MDEGAIHRRESIVLNAIDLINEFGIHSVSTKEIARRLGISESTIFKYFPKKNDLIMAVLEQFSVYDNDIFNTAINTMSNPKEAILFCLDSYLAYYENYPAITAVFQAYDVLRGVPELEQKAKSIFQNRLAATKKLIEEAQSAGVISSLVDADSLADIATALLRGICLKWRMFNFDFPLKQKAMQEFNMLFDAFSTSE